MYSYHVCHYGEWIEDVMISCVGSGMLPCMVLVLGATFRETVVQSGALLLLPRLVVHETMGSLNTVISLRY